MLHVMLMIASDSARFFRTALNALDFDAELWKASASYLLTTVRIIDAILACWPDSASLPESPKCRTTASSSMAKIPAT